jgi:uncharacterized protein involved in exopolysaccharide biosynthesis
VATIDCVYPSAPKALRVTEQIEPAVNRPSDVDSDKVDVIALLLALWHRRWLLVGITGAFIIFAIVYLQTANYQYLVQMQVTPSQGAASEAMRGRLGGLSGLAAMAGINIGEANTVSNYDLYLESLQSREVAESVARDLSIMKVVFSDEWDASTQNWQQPPKRMGGLKRVIKALLGIPDYPWQAPNGARMQQYLGDVIRVDRKPRSPIAVIRTYAVDPRFGMQLLNAVHRAADERLRAQALHRTDEYVKYLSSQLDVVTVSEHRQALAEAMSEQEKMRMMTRANTPFAAEPFGSATASLRPARPRPVAALAMGVLGGGFVGVMTVVLLTLRKQRVLPS